MNISSRMNNRFNEFPIISLIIPKNGRKINSSSNSYSVEIPFNLKRRQTHVNRLKKRIIVFQIKNSVIIKRFLSIEK